ncbi:PREDICTED: uncharacterized protein LOC105132954 isoform X2 [Populus euphratica]|uniref:Uncharacterized protein LOC105132954 isoform X2 n=1 Tax=Populus euphratica TaxID=75702 RepID=A0AAJ6UTF7_POPEU|nr:PREDICTED: uncharacterized protein LOC105132954 isoform X2 [Populus euphratica]
MQRLKEAAVVSNGTSDPAMPFLRNHCFCHAVFNYLLSESLILSIKAISARLSLTVVTASNRNVHFRSRRSEKTSGFGQEGNASDSDSESYKSRKQKKREARLAIRWGMELASFSPPQIKRIIKVASLEKYVFDALMLVKRPGPDVRQGKRRQYNCVFNEKDVRFMKMVIGVGCRDFLVWRKRLLAMTMKNLEKANTMWKRRHGKQLLPAVVLNSNTVGFMNAHVKFFSLLLV